MMMNGMMEIEWKVWKKNVHWMIHMIPKSIEKWVEIRSMKSILNRSILLFWNVKTLKRLFEWIYAATIPIWDHNCLLLPSILHPLCRIARSNAHLRIDDSHNSPPHSLATKRGYFHHILQDTSPISSLASENSQHLTSFSPSPVSPVSPISPREDGTPP